MWKSFALPMSALVSAVVLATVAVLSRSSAAALSELQIGLIAWSVLLAVFGIQGLVCSVLDGPEPLPGTVSPRPTSALILAIGVACVLLIGVAGSLGAAILSHAPVATLGTLGGLGFLLLACLLGAYKQAFLGNEVRIEPRRDGIPW